MFDTGMVFHILGVETERESWAFEHGQPPVLLFAAMFHERSFHLLLLLFHGEECIDTQP